MSQPVTAYAHRRYCDRCRRVVTIVVPRLTPRPTDAYWSARWDEAARRDGEAAFQERHVEACEPQIGGRR